MRKRGKRTPWRRKQAEADVAERSHGGFQDGGGGAVPGANPEDAGFAPEPRPADGYAPISIEELESRVERGAVRSEAAEESPESASEARYGAAGVDDETGVEGPPAGGPGPGEFEATGGGDLDGDEEFALTPQELEPEPEAGPGEGYDGLDYESDPEDPTGEIFDRGPIDETRRLPVALIAVIGVVVAVIVLVIGLGWMGGADEETPVASGQEAPTAATAEPAPAFSEPVAGEAAAEPTAAVNGSNDSPEMAAASPAGGSPMSAPPGDASPEARDAAPAAAVRWPAPAAAPAPSATPAAALALAPAVAPEPAGPSAPADGRLLVRSMPPGAEVIVNGQSRGTTPLALAGLPYGPYEVEVALAGYGSRREQFLLAAGDPIGSLNADLTADPPAPAAAPATTPAGSPPAAEVATGSILAETRPAGAGVWLDQRLVGETPMSIPDVPTGPHQIEFRLDGYRTWTTTVEVAPATRARVAASLDDAAR